MTSARAAVKETRQSREPTHIWRRSLFPLCKRERSLLLLTVDASSMPPPSDDRCKIFSGLLH